jgi:hypothetical protein
MLIGLLILSAIAAMYVAGAWALARRFGGRALVGAWLAATLVYAAFGLWRSHQAPTMAGVDQFVMFLMFLGLAVPAFGASSIIVYRRLRATPLAGLTSGTVLLGVGAFFAALGIVFLGVVAFDLGRLVTP